MDNHLGHPIRDDSFWLLVKLEKQLGRYDEAISFLNVLIDFLKAKHSYILFKNKA